jgi:PPOX class probable F420-dependent enzyme
MSRMNRFYDRIRHPAAADVATAEPVAGPFPDTEYVLVATYRRDGTPVPTPVWAAVDGDRLVFRSETDTAKVRRLRNEARVRVAPCTMRGKPTGPPIEATARIVGPQDDAAEQALSAKYGLERRVYERVVPHGDMVYVEIVR